MSYGLSIRFSFPLKLPWSQSTNQGRKTDSSIRGEVIEALGHCRSLSSDRIRVRVKDGVVYLHGAVASWENRRLAADAAWSIDGVVEVTSYLKVNV